MKHKSKTPLRLKNLVLTIGAMTLLHGCGGGGSSSPSLPTVPTPYDASYTANFVPSSRIPSGGNAPTGSISILNGRAALQTTYFLQSSVVKAVQAAIDNGLTNAGYAGAIADNQVPSNINFTGTGILDGSGKVVLTSREKVNICGTATLTIDSNFTNGASGQSGQGNYKVTFSDHLTLVVKGRKVDRSGSCNNLPLREGTVSFTR